ncbi:MAG: YraN family protein [Anaerolineae bacterium]|nr:YraN family protein [Anaerolineae bacterium]
MPLDRRGRGRKGEESAEQALLVAGYSIIEHNWQCPLGEIDIVAQHRGEWVFIEVRVRADGVDTALESVGRRKQNRLIRLAQAYLEAHELGEVAHRVDVVAIGTGSKQHEVEIIENAVGW